METEGIMISKKPNKEEMKAEGMMEMKAACAQMQACIDQIHSAMNKLREAE